MRHSFRARPKPFLDAARRQWQFDAFAWLLRGSGGIPKFQDTALVLPCAEHFPHCELQADLKDHAAAAALFRHVRDHAGMADWPCVAEPEPASPSPHSPGRIRIIHYSPSERRPERVITGFAHEMARYLVESLDQPPPGGAMLYEPVVDIAAVFMGFGVFMANSAAEQAGWDLNEGELVHALALFCRLRKLPVEAVEAHLNAHVRKYLRLAARDLDRFGAEFQRLGAVFPVTPADPGECTLPTGGR